MTVKLSRKQVCFLKISGGAPLKLAALDQLNSDKIFISDYRMTKIAKIYWTTFIKYLYAWHTHTH